MSAEQTKEETTPGGHPPVADPALYCGLLGEIVQTVDAGDHTEADPVGVFATLLAGAGVLLGPGPHIPIAATRHPLLVWPLLFGATATGRKGETYSAAALFLRACRDFDPISVSGLSSGEGLIERIRDPVDEDDPGGTEDKRLLVVESEFATMLNRAKRDGSTLAATLRQAWDGRGLYVLNRRALVASGSHVAVIGHVTPREFRARSADADMAGGTYNRFLGIYVDRARRLPLPEPIHPDVLDEFGGRLSDAIEKGRTIGPVALGARARRSWGDDFYDEFSGTDDADRRYTEFVRRAAPYCLRIAALHAVIDGRNEVCRTDLGAAAALVRYSIDTARYVLDRVAADPRQDRIRRAIAAAPDGLTRTEVSAIFSRNLPKATLDELLDGLVADGQFERCTTPTGGRPSVSFRLVSSFVPTH